VVPDRNLEALRKIERIVKLAELYCAMRSVSQRISMELLAWSARSGMLDFFPVHIITLASKVHSSILFNDAFVHLVGQWANFRHKSPGLNDEIRHLIDKEYMRIQELKLKVDRKLAFYVSNPPTGCETDVKQSLGRALKSFGSSDEEEATFYWKVAAIKGNWAESNLRPLVGPLTASETMMRNGFSYKHLTCAKLDGAFPW